MLMCVSFRALLHTRPRVQRAPGIPSSLFDRGRMRSCKTSGASRRENMGPYLKSEHHIARSEATKQSILSFGGEMDCFAEPVIGRAFARPGGSQMTVMHQDHGAGNSYRPTSPAGAA